MTQAARLSSVLICFFLLFAASSSAESPALSARELAYRERAGEIVIGCPVGNCPMLFLDEKTGEPTGVTIDILNMLSASTGLTFRYEALPSGSVTYQVLRQLGVDMVASVETNSLNKSALGIAMTDAYLHAAKVFACKKGVEIDAGNAITIALCSGSQTLEQVILRQYPHFRILYCDSVEEALRAVLRGKADAVLENQYAIERILRKPLFGDLRIVATAAIGDSQCLASVVPIGEDRKNLVSEDTELLISILNKGIACLDQGQVAFSIIRETSENAYHFTLLDAAYHYRYALVGLLVSLALVVALLRKNRLLHQKRAEQLAAQERARELAAVNAQMEKQQLLLMDALRRAEEASRAKTAFLFNMSHDIRTPMNAILGFTEIASRHVGDREKLTDCLEKIQSSGRHLLRLINDVLDMTKIESGRVTLSEDCCNLCECVGKACDTLRPQIARKSLNLHTDLSTVSDPWVHGDALRLGQILYNLLSNAVKFTNPGGGIWVTLRQKPCAMAEYAAYELRVRDNGIGILESFLPHIFEPFERERSSTISNTQGAGLGLSITKNLVDLMGGSIEAVSKPDQGAEFIVQFTFKLRTPPPKPSPEPAPTPDFSGKRLLLVDDNELNMELAQELLREAGFDVETASNGQIAVDMVSRSVAGYYDAVLMDIQMPVMNGYEASQAIRAFDNAGLARVPIIALTANAFDEDKKEALAHGMDAHIAKPIDVAVLYETLGRVLR